MNKNIRLDFASIKLCENFAIGVMDEGIELKTDNNKFLLNTLKKEYKDQFFGFISNRINSYSVDPIVYKETSELENLIAIAVVMSNPMQKLSIEVEKLFYNRPFEYFDNIEDARTWIKQTLEREINNKP
ncbi:hypothetical protein GTQ40_05450 [Flavobacteriaceae bacterium R38]|nr:hypothetical protein [Flavobacteriaceae bacterium R38]